MSNIVVKPNNPYDIDTNLWAALKNSLYPGAKDESIKMVVEYCKAAELDPLQKPVHIVPMSVKNQYGKYDMKDTVMVGIGLYRIQAARSNQYAGVGEPEFGSDITVNLGGVNMTYPEYCKITVKKMVNGAIVEFTAKEYWLENYATAGRDSQVPNMMWKKRPYGQLAKCTEAQALRKAFPEFVSQQPTAEEMEGKIINEFNNDLKNITPKSQDVSSKLDDLIIEQNIEAADSNIDKVDMLSELIVTHNIPAELIEKWCNKAGVSSIQELDDIKLESCINYISSHNSNISH